MKKQTVIAIALALAAFNVHAAEKTNDQLCQRYNLFHSKSVRAELVKRDALTADEWAAVDAEHIVVGMSVTAVRCARGKPFIEKRETETGTVDLWRYFGKQHETISVRDGRVVEYYATSLVF